MVSKTCPSCTTTIPLATKNCSCGYAFGSKKAKNTPKENETNTINKDQDDEPTSSDMSRQEQTYEEFITFKNSQTTIIDKLDCALAELTSSVDEINKEMTKYKENITNEIKDYLGKTIEQQRKEMELKYEAMLKDQKNEITRLGSQVRLLTKRVEELESSDSDSDTESESEPEDKNEKEEIQTQIPTSNRFAQLDANQNNEPKKIFSHDTPINHPPEREKEPIIRKNILIASDSMMRRIDGNKLSPNNNIYMKYVRGGTEQMTEFLGKQESEEAFDKILIHTGTNDVKKMANEKIIENTKNIIQESTTRWPEAEIYISSLIYHKTDTAKNDLIDVINKGVNEVCANINNVFFMDNSHITLNRDGTIDSDAFYDNIHLNDHKGIRKLAANVIKTLNLRQASQHKERPYNRNYRSRQNYGRSGIGQRSNRSQQHRRQDNIHQNRNGWHKSRDPQDNRFDQKLPNLGGLLTAIAELIGNAL